MRTFLLACAACVSLSSTARAATSQGSGVQTEPAAALAGTYKAPVGYPRVFMTKAKALAMIASTNPSVINMLVRLKTASAAYVAKVSRYTAPYVGTDLTREEKQWAIPVGPTVLQLAMYAYLADLDAGYGDTTTARQAHDAAVQIVTAWVNDGFQDASGKAINSYTQFTTGGVTDGTTQAMVELDIGRGVTPWTLGLDFLIADGLTSAQFNAFTAFEKRLLNIMIGAANFHFTEIDQAFPNTGCNRFDNQSWQGLLAIATAGRLLSRADVAAALAGTDNGTLLKVSFPMQIEGNFYGTNDVPRTCSPLSYSASNSDGSPRFFQTLVVAAGEIVDRFRAMPGQQFGYTLGNLELAVEAADLMAAQGFNLANFAGPKGQGIKMTLDYYAEYANQYLTLTAGYRLPANGTIADYAQYEGARYTVASTNASVEGNDNLLPPYVLGLHLFPKDTAITNLIAKDVALAATVPTPAYDAFDAQGWADWVVPAK